MSIEVTSVRRLVVHWPRLGPYHLARLRGAHELFSARGVIVTALEIAGLDRTYGWKKEEQPTAFERRTLFPDRYYEDLYTAELRGAIYAALDELSPEVVAINGYAFRDSRFCLDWCKSRDRKAILMTETTKSDKARDVVRELLKRLLLRRFAVAICGGTRHRDYLLSLGMPSYRIFTKYDVVDNDRFAAPPGERAERGDLPGLEYSRPFFLASNRFIGRKNLGTLLTAYAKYRSRSPDGWRLVLLGSGEQEPELRKRAADENIADVTFAGFRQIDELSTYYAAAGCFIHPAITEPWGLVVNEAMAAGLPVIVSNGCGCAPDLVEHGRNGFVFNPRDADELSAHLTSIAGDPRLQRQMGARSRELISNWTIHDFAKDLWKAFVAPRAFHRLVAFGERKVVAYPQARIGKELRYIGCLRPVTLRQQTLATTIQFCVSAKLDRFLFRQTAMDDPDLLPSDVFHALEEVGDRLGARHICYTMAWPAQPASERMYAFAFGEGVHPVAFVKVSESEKGAAALANEFDALQALEKLPQDSIRFPRPLFTGRSGVTHYHVSECVSLERGTMKKRGLAVLNYIQSYSGTPVRLSSDKLRDIAWVADFWRAIPADSVFAQLLVDDLQHDAECCRVHGDFTRANIIASGNQAWIIDWEVSDPLGPKETDTLTLFLSDRQRGLVRNPSRVLLEFRQKFIDGRAADQQRDARLGLAFLYGRDSGLGRRIVDAWDTAAQ